MNKERYLEIVAKLRGWCSLRDRSRQEVSERAQREGLSGEWLIEALTVLESEHYVSDDRYAASFVSGHIRLKKWGRIKVRQALRQKGISDAGIEAAFRQEVNEEEYRATLLDLLKRKSESTALSHPAGRQKIIRFALQKGYEYDLIQAGLNQLTETED